VKWLLACSVPVLILPFAAAAQPQDTDGDDTITVTAERAVTATKTDTPIVETPQAISVVEDSLFRERGALNVQETLRYSAGVTAEAYGLDTRNDSTLIRGLSPVQFLDGMRNFYTFAPFARVAVDTLDRVEVLRGPSSVLYGQASNGGIVNSVSKTPDFGEFRGIARIEYGSWDRKQGLVDFNAPLDTAGSLAARVVGVIRDANQQTREIEDDRFLVAPSLAWRPGPDTQVTLIGVAQRDTAASSQQFLPVVATLLAPSAERRIDNRTFLGDADFDTLKQRSFSATLIVDHRFSELLSISGRTRYIDAKTEFRELYPRTRPIRSSTGPQPPGAPSTASPIKPGPGAGS
jgi:iron complex outermembrane recepter protein